MTLETSSSLSVSSSSVSKRQQQHDLDHPDESQNTTTTGTHHRHSTGVPPANYRPRSPPPVKYRSSRPDSSKDYFTLQFYDDEELPLDTEKVPVKKGKSLKESIESVLSNHGVDFSTHSVFLEASKTPLPLMFDTFPLGGNTLHVKENQVMQVDERIITLMKEEDKKPQENGTSQDFDVKNQGHVKQKKLMNIFADDSDASSRASSLSRDNASLSKGSLRSGSSKDLSRTNLTDTLAQYEINGFTLNYDEVNSLKDLDIALEESWTDVIDEKDDMLREEKIQQEAIWELLLTERNYLRVLRLITQHEMLKVHSITYVLLLFIIHESSYERKKIAYVGKMCDVLQEKGTSQDVNVKNQVFKHCLKNLQQDNFLTEIDNHKLFSNINDIYKTNHTLWSEHVVKVIAEARESKEPIKPSQLRHTFSNEKGTSQDVDVKNQFGERFEPYINYCLEESSCVKYLKHLKKHNENFEEYLAVSICDVLQEYGTSQDVDVKNQWCENRPQCNRLRLQDLLVKPMQRITRYGLLLKAILRKTRDEHEKQTVNIMLAQVESFVMKINTTMRTRHEQHKLNEVLARIDTYYPVEPVNEDVEKEKGTSPDVDVKNQILLEYCSLNLHGRIPGLPDGEQRCILMEAPMKLTEKHGKIEVHVFLFTDVLVITKPKKGGDRFRIVRQPYRLNKVQIHIIKEANSFLLIYLNEYGVLVNAFILQVTSTDYMKWIQAIERAKSRYMKARAGQGSTLDFYDDDIFSNHNSNANEFSPMPDRHPIILREDSSSNMPMNSSGAHLRSNSSIQISNRRAAEHPEVAVKRSASDPKSGSWNRDKRKHRPMSLISSSDCDTASWVLNEKRNRSDSIPSDMSEDSRRSSGIGDSFRSINSDGALPLRAGGSLTKSFSSYPEVSNVMKLKARFEHADSSSTDGSNTSISKTNEQTQTRQTGGTPDFLENHSTIQEEEEHSSNNSNGKTSVSSDPSPYENIDLIRSAMLQSLKDDSQTETLDSVVDTKEVGIQVHIEDIIGDTSCTKISDVPREEGVIQDIDVEVQVQNAPELRRQRLEDHHIFETNLSRSSSNSSSFSAPEEINSDELLGNDNPMKSIEHSSHHVATQCDCPIETRDVCTQCGDFIQLTGVSESDTDDGDIDTVDEVKTEVIVERPSSAPPSAVVMNYDTPMMNMLNPSLAAKQPKGILKHSFSEANIQLASQRMSNRLTPEHEIAHSRSRSDEPKQSVSTSPRQKHRNSTSTYDYPGMRALQTLSESLESSLQQRQTIADQNKPIVKHTEQKTHSQQNGTSPVINKHTSDTENELPGRVSPETDTYNNDALPHRSTSSFVPLRDQQGREKATNDYSKRNTWHDFDSMQALKDIERTKYGSQGNLNTIDELKVKSLDRKHSQSTEELDNRKRHSLKKPFFKKFSSASMINDGNNVDQKAAKKFQKKEKERIKKEKKLKEKEDKKKEKNNRYLGLGKLRSGSFSSTTSSKSNKSRLSTTVE